ncbi:PadR family transcriptional regulator [Plantactinospora solaniradicis]|uniref:PadR family transcriptional regulator n=1 Tax=Plantactinospora solaniradicis TaxID=1723736 RepID=A0ABW1K4N0_9ACTN
MNATRLFVLGALARGGPMHGHKIRQDAQLDQVELWTDMKPGSLYGALRRMATEGVIAVARTEQEGNLPARTVYEITEAGRREFAEQLHAVLGDARLRPDPVDLALQHASAVDPATLLDLIRKRRTTLAERLAFMRALRQRAEPHLTGLEPVAFDHTLMRLEVEVAWHDRLLAALTEQAR